MTTTTGTPELSLGPAAEAQWARLRRQLEYADGFWLGFAFSASPAEVRVLQRRTENVLRARARRQQVLWPESPDALIAQAVHLAELSTEGALGCVWLTCLAVDDAGAHGGQWQRAWDRALLALNQAREPLRRQLVAGLVVAAPHSVRPRVREAAPDLWSIRSLVIDLPGASGLPAPPDRPAERAPEPITRDRAQHMAAERPRQGATGSSPKARDLLRRADRLLAGGDPPQAIEPAQEALSLARAAHDPELVATILAVLADAESRSDDVGAATDHIAEAIELRRAMDDAAALAALLDRSADLALARGDLAAATAAYDESLTIRRRLLDTYGDTPQALRDLTVSLDKLGDTRLQAGDLAAATAAYDESLTIARRLLDTYGDTPQALRDLTVSLGRVAALRREAGDEAAVAALEAEAAALAPRLARLVEAPSKPAPPARTTAD
ncbi:MAG TPA: hypothetical protein VGF63_03655 [Solirubrobacteraceae bacterium]